MTICDKIQNVGDTLETNLNNRGVSCTFGTGSGESTILDMANLITSSNLKGANDALISITANRPYLLSGETTDLTVKLVNGLGEPLPNKSITVSDGSSLYSGITNTTGEFCLYGIGITEDTTFTATYSNVSATCEVAFCDFVDYGVTNRVNTDDWNNASSRLTVTVTSNGKLLESSSSGYGYYITKNYQYTDYIIEFDVVSLTDLVAFYCRASTSDVQIVGNLTTIGVTNGDHVKIVVDDGEFNLWANGVKKTVNPIAITPNGATDVGFRFSNQNGKTITFKNFHIQKL